MISEFRGYSQAGQDRFAYEICGRRHDGTFVDIGCGDPISCNNTYGLEQIGWRGLIVDRFADVNRDRLRPRSVSKVGDAATLNWKPLFELFFDPVIDYLSIDCDENTVVVLRALPHATNRFRAITIEHDKYLRGPQLQIDTWYTLNALGYDCVCKDVLFEGRSAFEDWWRDPTTTDDTIASRLRATGVDGAEILSRL